MTEQKRGRRVLVVAYYFPPAGGPGVQRVLKTVKYLRRFGWEPTVLTVADGAFPQHDPSLEVDVPDDVVVVRTRALDPLGLYGRITGRRGAGAVPVGSVGSGAGVTDRVARWARANVFLPDARVGWVPFATRAALRMHAEHQFDAVLTSGPPHSVHLVGRRLARRAGLPWVADFRDPWTGINFYQDLPMSAPARRLDRRLESSVLREADRITTVSPTWAATLASKGDRRDDHVMVVHNGFDPDDFATPAPAPDDVFTLAHVGSLYGSRNPATLWEALATLARAGKLDRFRLKLRGGVDEPVLESARGLGLEDRVEGAGYVGHAAAVGAMRAATALLLVVEDFGLDRGMITGKLYEYLGAGRPVVGIGPPDGDAAALLAETSAGAMFAHGDVASLAGHLEALLARADRGAAAGAAPAVAARYTREVQTGVLAGVLDSAVGA